MHANRHAPEHSGNLAVLAWIGCGIYIVWMDVQLRYLSWAFLVYISIGTILGGTILDGIYHHIRTIFAAIIGATVGNNGLRTAWPLVTLALLVGLVFFTFHAADFAMRKLQSWLGSAPTSAMTADGVVHCSEPLPPFTLDGLTMLTARQSSHLCACTWDQLDDDTRTFFKQIGVEESAAAEHFDLVIESATERFGRALFQCRR